MSWNSMRPHFTGNSKQAEKVCASRRASVLIPAPTVLIPRAAGDSVHLYRSAGRQRGRSLKLAARPF